MNLLRLFKQSLVALTAASLLLAMTPTSLEAKCKTKTFVAYGEGSTKAEARADAKRKLKKKVAAYKKRHPGCKVKVVYP